MEKKLWRHSIPEWVDLYIDYAGIKKWIGQRYQHNQFVVVHTTVIPTAASSGSGADQIRSTSGGAMPFAPAAAAGAVIGSAVERSFIVEMATTTREAASALAPETLVVREITAAPSAAANSTVGPAVTPSSLTRAAVDMLQRRMSTPGTAKPPPTPTATTSNASKVGASLLASMSRAKSSTTTHRFYSIDRLSLMPPGNAPTTGGGATTMMVNPSIDAPAWIETSSVVLNVMLGSSVGDLYGTMRGATNPNSASGGGGGSSKLSSAGGSSAVMSYGTTATTPAAASSVSQQPHSPHSHHQHVDIVAAHVKHMQELNFQLAVKLNDACKQVDEFYRRELTLFCRNAMEIINYAKSIRSDDLVFFRDEVAVLKEGFQRVHFALTNLRRFAEDNVESVLHLVHKVEERTHFTVSHAYAQHLNARFAFCAEVDHGSIDKLCALLETTLTNTVCRGNKKAASRILHVDDESQHLDHVVLNTGTVGLLAGALLTLLVFCTLKYHSMANEIDIALKSVVVAAHTSGGGGGAAATAVTTVVAPPGGAQQRYTTRELVWITGDATGLEIFTLTGLVLLMGLYFAVNVTVWTLHNLNFAYILDVADEVGWSGHDLLVRALRNCIVYLIGLYTFLTFKSKYVDDVFVTRGLRAESTLWTDLSSQGAVPLFHHIPYATVAILMLLVLYDHAMRPTIWLGKTLFRTVLAPLFNVTFADFFIADQLTSLTGCFFEIQFVFCLFHDQTNSRRNAYCHDLRTQGLPYLAAFPHLWRFLQCFRRYYDSPAPRNFHPHISNALKYLSGIAAIFSAFTYRNAHLNAAHGESTEFVFWMWVVCMFVEFVFKTYWDIVVDAGLFTPGSQAHGFLRNKLFFPRRVYYEWALTNVLLRLNPLMRTFSVRWLGFDQWYAFFLWSSIEVTRRFLWNFFRMENEQATNPEKYRDVTLVPPPKRRGPSSAAGGSTSSSSTGGGLPKLPSASSPILQNLPNRRMLPPKCPPPTPPAAAAADHPPTPAHHQPIPSSSVNVAAPQAFDDVPMVIGGASLAMSVNSSRGQSPGLHMMDKGGGAADANGRGEINASEGVVERSIFCPQRLFSLLTVHDQRAALNLLNMERGAPSSSVWRATSTQCGDLFATIMSEADRVRLLQFVLGNETEQAYLSRVGGATGATFASAGDAEDWCVGVAT